MAVEYFVKRTVWVAKCDCGQVNDVVADNAPKSIFAKCCNKWIDYKEETYTGKDFSKEKK